nr:MAG TPA: hypothetical protein [Caudoviricetes sp.]
MYPFSQNYFGKILGRFVHVPTHRILPSQIKAYARGCLYVLWYSIDILYHKSGDASSNSPLFFIIYFRCS